MVDSNSAEENNAHTTRNISDGDEEDNINNEEESEHSKLPVTKSH